mmetsp:Transcript_16456/g.34947  ORF Transcript_16456/g.34947 Transcript_16456/m.34947 type:complete len:83 (+) Transcript_16456:655-903(+)
MLVRMSDLGEDERLRSRSSRTRRASCVSVADVYRCIAQTFATRLRTSPCEIAARLAIGRNGVPNVNALLSIVGISAIDPDIS